MSVKSLAPVRIGLASTGLLWGGLASAASSLNMTQGVTPISREIYDLHMLIFWICVVIGVVVFGVMFYSMFHHRKSRGVVPAKFHHSTTVELIWTIIPMIILVAMAIPATKTLIKMEDTGNSDMTVKVTGYQWKWKYDYMEEDISFYSNLSTSWTEIRGEEEKGEHYLLEVDNPLVLPVGKKVRILTTASDVIHAWWVPDLGWKRDAIPGFINDNWVLIEEEGTYRGQCAELCGKDHGFMPIVVVAKNEADYAKWVEETKGGAAAQVVSDAAAVEREWPLAELMAQGEKVYNANCVACHQAEGVGVPPAFPALAGSAIATGPIADHVNIVMNGKAGTAMAAFKDQFSDADLASIITYTRNAFGNEKGDSIQPAAVKALR